MIYLVRHGLDDENYIGGYSDITLIEEGIKQANEAGLWLKENIKDINIIYTSDVKRALQTSEIINNYLNLGIYLKKELRELDKGLLNGMEKEQAKIIYPEYMQKIDINTKYPNGESMVDLYQRIKVLLDELKKYDNSLIVTHRGVINMIYILLNNDVLTMDKEKYNVTHASVHELDLDKRLIKRIR